MADQTEPQEGSKEDQLNWEESSLVRFSQFLGFSTEGLEVEILNFLDKIRKRKEKIIAKKKGPMKGRGNQKVVIRSQKVDLFCLQETKVQVMSDEMVRSLGRGDTLIGRFRNEGDGAIWVFTGVYGPFSREDREGLWEELGAIRGLWEEPWCLGGDFNITLYIDDRNRTGRITSAMRRFAQIIDELGLVDIPLQGGSFTWSGGLNNQTRARLDRFLATPCWLDQFSRVLNRRLPRPTSDHYPILLEGGGGWWQGIEVSGRPSYRLATKLKGLKQNLKTWNKEVFGRLEKNKADALQQVESWDSVEEVRSLTEVELNQKKEAKESYEKWVSMEEVHWRQLSRELWLREGDRNTGFFHRMANAHRRINAMSKIMINGVSFTEDQDMREGIANAYQQFLSENPGWKADIGGLLMNQISPSEADGIEVPFSETEIFTALKGMCWALWSLVLFDPV
ncbi:hypothetical protein CK203_097452 [Vitis vinifera]|uniref:Endonuclease/exonuclease/phosphatase domain-containing protein n=1 Tax=Vitis vinifera TaxID=29760 RepID=A0A438BTV8_VITVI|nr:hypothetical protein CK203_097452 [Vitis vinifera]